MFEVSREGALCVCRTCHQTKQMVATSSSVFFNGIACLDGLSGGNIPKSAGICLLRRHASHITERARSPDEAHHSFKPDEGKHRKVPTYKKIFEWFLHVWCLPVLPAPLFSNCKNFNGVNSVCRICNTSLFPLPQFSVNTKNQVLRPPNSVLFSIWEFRQDAKNAGIFRDLLGILEIYLDQAFCPQHKPWSECLEISAMQSRRGKHNHVWQQQELNPWRGIGIFLRPL